MELRRSELATPATSERMIKKATETSADLVFLDLEDAVAPDQKEQARLSAAEALTDSNWGEQLRGVRINGLETPHFYEDVVTVVERAGYAVDVIIVPKVASANDVVFLDRLLTLLEQKIGMEREIKIEVLIETVDGVINVEQIARSSTRLSGLILGTGDLSVSQRTRTFGREGIDESMSETLWLYARSKLVLAARAAGIAAIDGAYAAYKDLEGYRREAFHASVLGFDGKWAIHPEQVGVANEVFCPSDSEVHWARSTIDAYRKSSGAGKGAMGLDGQLIDAATALIAQGILERHAKGSKTSG